MTIGAATFNQLALEECKAKGVKISRWQCARCLDSTLSVTISAVSVIFAAQYLKFHFNSMFKLELVKGCTFQSLDNC